MAASSAAMSPKLPWRMAKRGSVMDAAAATASGSRSKATNRPCGPSACSTARAWPPRPKVPSTYTPPACVTKACTASVSKTVVWDHALPALTE